MPSTSLAYDLRIACMRLVRRVRYTTESLPPHLFAALAPLDEGIVSTAAELAARERVSAPSMSRTVNELVDRGFVAREADATDRRRQLLTVTPGGREALAAARRERDEWMTTRLGALSPADRATLEQATQIINKMLDEQ